MNNAFPLGQSLGLIFISLVGAYCGFSGLMFVLKGKDWARSPASLYAPKYHHLLDKPGQGLSLRLLGLVFLAVSVYMFSPLLKALGIEVEPLFNVVGLFLWFVFGPLFLIAGLLLLFLPRWWIESRYCHNADRIRSSLIYRWGHRLLGLAFCAMGAEITLDRVAPLLGDYGRQLQDWYLLPIPHPIAWILASTIYAFVFVFLGFAIFNGTMHLVRPKQWRLSKWSYAPGTPPQTEGQWALARVSSVAAGLVSLLLLAYIISLMVGRPIWGS